MKSIFFFVAFLSLKLVTASTDVLSTYSFTHPEDARPKGLKLSPDSKMVKDAATRVVHAYMLLNEGYRIALQSIDVAILSGEYIYLELTVKELGCLSVRRLLRDCGKSKNPGNVFKIKAEANVDDKKTKIKLLN